MKQIDEEFKTGIMHNEEDDSDFRLTNHVNVNKKTGHFGKEEIMKQQINFYIKNITSAFIKEVDNSEARKG
jgi:hypothetical protein